MTDIRLHRIIVIAIYRLLAFRDFSSTSNPLFDRVVLVAWTQGEQAYSLVTATIPSLTPFLAKMNTGLGALSRDDFITHTTNQESGGSFAMQSLKPGRSGNSKVSENIRERLAASKRGWTLFADKRCSGRCERTTSTSNRW